MLCAIVVLLSVFFYYFVQFKSFMNTSQKDFEKEKKKFKYFLCFENIVRFDFIIKF